MPFSNRSAAAARVLGLTEAAPGPRTTRPLEKGILIHDSTTYVARTPTWLRSQRLHTSSSRQSPLKPSQLVSSESMMISLTVAIKNGDCGQYASISDVEVGASGRISRAKEIVRLSRKESTEVALLKSFECVRRVGVHLCRVEDRRKPGIRREI